MRKPCDVCEGTGRTTPDNINDPSGRTWKCHGGCDDGYVDMIPEDLDGLNGRYGGVAGALFLMRGVLCLEAACGMLIVNLQPHNVEIIDAEI